MLVTRGHSRITNIMKRPMRDGESRQNYPCLEVDVVLCSLYQIPCEFLTITVDSFSDLHRGCGVKVRRRIWLMSAAESNAHRQVCLRIYYGQSKTNQEVSTWWIEVRCIFSFSLPSFSSCHPFLFFQCLPLPVLNSVKKYEIPLADI